MHKSPEKSPVVTTRRRISMMNRTMILYSHLSTRTDCGRKERRKRKSLYLVYTNDISLSSIKLSVLILHGFHFEIPTRTSVNASFEFVEIERKESELGRKHRRIQS